MLRSMKTVEIYDPALCCSSGACGPAPDQALAAFAGALERLKSTGVAVRRYNLAQEPLAFANRPEVKAALEERGEAGLPLVFVDGAPRFQGEYPSAELLSEALGIEAKTRPSAFVKAQAPRIAGSGCCDSATGCC